MDSPEYSQEEIAKRLKAQVGEHADVRTDWRSIAGPLLDAAAAELAALAAAVRDSAARDSDDA